MTGAHVWCYGLLANKAPILCLRTGAAEIQPLILVCGCARADLVPS